MEKSDRSLEEELSACWRSEIKVSPGCLWTIPVRLPGSGSVGKSSCCADTRTLAQVPSIHIKSTYTRNRANGNGDFSEALPIIFLCISGAVSEWVLLSSADEVQWGLYQWLQALENSVEVCMLLRKHFTIHQCLKCLSLLSLLMVINAKLANTDKIWLCIRHLLKLYS